MRLIGFLRRQPEVQVFIVVLSVFITVINVWVIAHGFGCPS